VKDSENKVISSVYSIAEDLDGNIWVGTDQGPAIYYNPSAVFDEEIRAYRVKVPRDDGTGLADYMLGTEIITSIAVDGANMATASVSGNVRFQICNDERGICLPPSRAPFSVALAAAGLSAVDCDDPAETAASAEETSTSASGVTNSIGVSQSTWDPVSTAPPRRAAHPSRRMDSISSSPAIA